MSELAILIYGYQKEHVDAIAEALTTAVGQQVGVISGHGSEDRIVQDILAEAPFGDFADNEHKILYFVNFSEEQMYDSMVAFPDKTQNVPRPVFALPTPDNVTWQLGKLLTNLAEHAGEHHED